MAKKIMVLNGSPRMKGNTAALIEAFTQGAEQAGHSVERFDLQKMDIHPCVGCLRGGKEGLESPCTQKDGMDAVYRAFLGADVLVLASPLYYWSFSAQLKMAIDRLFAVTEANGMQTPGKACAMLMAAEASGEEHFRLVTDYYESLLGFLGWEDLGKVIAGGVYEVGDIAGKPALEEARVLGASV